MQALQKKIKRVLPLIQARKAQLDQEAAILAQIRHQKLETVAQLKEQQRQYMNGVEKLNRERQAGNLGQLRSLETGLDLVKSRWYESLKTLRHIEAKERAQVAQVMVAQVNLKSMEKLNERYSGQLSDVLKKQEQKALDEVSVQRFSRSGF